VDIPSLAHAIYCIKLIRVQLLFNLKNVPCQYNYWRQLCTTSYV